MPQYNIHNRNVHISVLNGALWDIKQVHSGICDIGLLQRQSLLQKVMSIKSHVDNLIDCNRLYMFMKIHEWNKYKIHFIFA